MLTSSRYASLIPVQFWNAHGAISVIPASSEELIFEAPILVPLDSSHSTTPALLPLPSTLQSSPSAQAYPPGDVNPTSVSSLQPANGTSAMVQPNLPLNGPAQPAAPANQTVQPAKKETPEEHRAIRQAQWEAAYDNRRDAWYQQIIKDGGSKELAGELADANSPEVAKSGKPPRVVFGTATSRTVLS